MGVNLLHTMKQRRALRQPLIFQHSMATWTVEDQELKAVQLRSDKAQKSAQNGGMFVSVIGGCTPPIWPADGFLFKVRCGLNVLFFVMSIEKWYC